MYRISQGIFGQQPISLGYDPDTTQRHELGLHADGVSKYWGGGRFVYGKAGGTLEMGSVVQPDQNWLFTDHPNSTNTGRPIYSAIYGMVANEFGWFQCSGQMILSATGSVAADTAVGITAAGQVGANAAGKQLLGYRNLLPGTTTVVKSCETFNGRPQLNIISAGVEGWFQGVTVTGTGIPGSTTIASLDANGREVTMSANATASGIVSVTGTYTNFLVGIANHPFVQGAIT